MASLTKDSRGRSPFYICCYTGPDGRRIKRSTKQTNKEKAQLVCLTFLEAERKIAKESATEQQLRKVINSALDRLGERKLSDCTVRQQLQTWIDSKAGALAAGSLTGYKQARELLLEFLGARAERSVRLVTKADAIALRDKLVAQGRTPNTVNKLTIKYLGSAFSEAVEEGVIESNPFASIDPLKESKITKGTFSPEQIAQLLAVSDNDWQGCILLGYSTGARLQDAANMKWSAIDVPEGLISFVEGKTNKETITGLHADLLEWITRQPGRDNPDAPLFPSLAGKKSAGDYGLSTQFTRIMKKAGVAGKELRSAKGVGHSVSSHSFHSLRHTAVSTTFNRAIALDTARKVSGHSAGGAISNYAHLDTESIRAATSLIPRLPKGGV
jgi:integrase